MRRNRAVRRGRLGAERLETRLVPAINFSMAFGLGAAGPFPEFRANAVAEDAAGDVVVVGSIRGTADFDPGSGTTNLSNAGNQDAFVAEYTSTGALSWAETFPGQSSSSVGQATGVAVDGSGNILVTGSFSGTVRFGVGAGAPTLQAPSRTDVYAVKLDGSGQPLWAVASAGQTYDSDSAAAIVPDGSGGAYIAGNYMDSATFGGTTLTAAGLSEAFAAHISSSGGFTWAESTVGSGTSQAGMLGLALDPGGRLVMGGFFSGTVDFDPSGGVSGGTLTGAGSRDVAVWVLDSAGHLAWARGVGGPNYDEASGVAVDAAGDVYATGAFSGTVNFDPAGPPANLSATGTQDVFVLKLGPDGSFGWADSFAGSTGASQGQGIAVDGQGRLIVGGWFSGSVEFDPSGSAPPLVSAGAEDVFAAALDGQGNGIGAVQGGGTNADLALGLAIDASGTVAMAGMYTGPAGFGPINVPAKGQQSLFVAGLSLTGSSPPPAPRAPALDPSSNSGGTAADLTNDTSPAFDVVATAPNLTVRLYRDGSPVGARVGTGTIGDPGPVPQGLHQYVVRQFDPASGIGPPSSSTSITIDTTPPLGPSILKLAPSDDSGTQGDGITNVVQPHLIGSAEAGSIVTLLNASGLPIGQAGAAADGSFTVQPTAPLPSGLNTLSVRATDAAGNVGPAGPGLTITILTAPPATPPRPTLAPADDSGVKGDGITNVTRPHFSGMAAAGVTINLYGPAGLLGSAVADGNGLFSVAPTSPLPNGPITLYLQAVDVAANLGAAGPSIAITIQTAPPAPPTAGLLPADDTGVKGDGVTRIRHPRIAGLAPPGAEVDLLDGSGSLVASTAADPSTGAYTLTTPAGSVGTYAYSVRATDVAGNQGAPGALPSIRLLGTLGDYDGDGMADPASYNPVTAVWAIRSSATGLVTTRQFGEPGVDIPEPADYFGDGRTDIAVYRPTTGDWYILNPSTNAVVHYNFGWPGVDLPVPGDYDGDGKADIAVYRPNSGQWFIMSSRTGVTSITAFGWPGNDQPVPADYDGDGKVDIAVFRPTSDQWFVRRSTDGTTSITSYGYVGHDRPIPADFDGDGFADIAVYRPSTGQWFIDQSSTGATRVVGDGWPGVDQAVPADYDGDGMADLIVWRPPSGQFFIRSSIDGSRQVIAMGTPGVDRPAMLPLSYQLVNLTLQGGSASTAARQAPARPSSTTPAPARPAVATAFAAGSRRAIPARAVLVEAPRGAVSWPGG